MRLSTLSLSSFFAVSFLGLMVLSPSNAQTFRSEERELGAFALGAGTITPGPKLVLMRPPRSRRRKRKSGLSSGSEPESDGKAATPETEENAETEPGTQPESNPSAAQSEPETTGATNPNRFSDSDQHRQVTSGDDGVRRWH